MTLTRSLWVVNHYARGPGSTGSTRHFDLAKGLEAYGWKTTIVASSFDHWAKRDENQNVGPRFFEETFSGVRFVWVRTPSYRGNDLRRIFNILTFGARALRLYPRFDAEPPNAVIGSSFHPLAAWVGLKIAESYDCPFLFEVRDLWPETLVELGGFSRGHPAVRALAILERHLSAKATRIISLLKASGQHFDEIGGFANKVVWIPNGVDLSRYEADVRLPPTVQTIMDGLRDKFIVCYAGSHGLANSLKTLVDAATLVQDSDNDTIRFVLVGDGPEKRGLVRLAQDRGLTNVLFLDPLPKEVIPALLRQVHAAVICIAPNEIPKHGISMNKITDYMAAGLPVVMTGTGPGNPVEESSGGSILPAGDSEGLADVLRRWSRSPEACQELGRRARNYVEQRYSTQRLAQSLANVLEESLSEKLGRGGLNA